LSSKSSAGCAANMPEFNLRQLKDIEYISDTLARPRGIRKSISPASIGGPRKQGGCEPTGRRGVAVSTSDFSFCVVVAMAACLTSRPSRWIPVIRTGVASN
jgi:hypothetical protein